MLDPAENFDLNCELLPEEKVGSPKRGSKDEVITKIFELNDTAQLNFLQESRSKLKRKTKADLNKMLAEMVELSVLKRTAHSVGAPLLVILKITVYTEYIFNYQYIL